MRRSSSWRGWTGFSEFLLLCCLAASLLSPGCEEKPQFLLEPAPVDRVTTLIDRLGEAYEQRDGALFESLLAHGAEANTRFRFDFPGNPKEPGPFSWGFEEELRIHRRMFRPQDIPASASPIIREWWPERITVRWVQARPFEEREGFYSEDGGLDGKLDRSRWRVTESLYWTYALFELEGETDFAIDEQARFVVLEDRHKNVGDPGKFQILQWEEIPLETKQRTQSIHASGWSQVKGLYR